MKLMAQDLGACGVVQAFYAGKVKFDDTGVSTGVKLFKAEQNMIITRVVADVKAAFNAGTTNVLVIGTKDDDDAIVAAAGIDESSATVQNVNTFVKIAKGTEVLVKYTQTGTAASTGEAEFHVFAVGCPE